LEVGVGRFDGRACFANVSISVLRDEGRKKRKAKELTELGRSMSVFVSGVDEGFVWEEHLFRSKERERGVRKRKRKDATNEKERRGHH